jgi:hypothetical protein
MSLRSASAALLSAALSLSSLPSPASASFTFGTAMAQDPLPECQTQVLCNGPVFCADVCVDGTVVLDPWLTSSVRFQYNLTRDRSFKFGPILGTHNAFISRANGLGLTEDFTAALYSRTLDAPSTHVRIPNQRLGPLTLLDLGVRELEFDIWDITWDGISAFEIYMCHSPVPDPTGFLDVETSAKALGVDLGDWDPLRELCSNHTLKWAMGQVAGWIARPENADEVVALFLDNRVWTPNIDLVTNAITSTWGDALLTPGDVATLFNGSFPSRAQMRAAGKSAYCESNSYVSNNYTNTSLSTACFYPTTWSTMQLGDGGITPYPNCSAGAGSPDEGSWYGRDFVRVLDSGDLAWAPTEEAESGLILKPNGVADLVNCGFNNIGMADVSPAAVEGFVWSWAKGQPPAAAPSGPCRAAAMTLVRGQWTAQPCTSLYPAVCRQGDNRVPAGDRPDLWRLTNTSVAFVDAPAACQGLGAGWAFDVPRDGRENQVIASLMLFGGLWGKQQAPSSGAGAWVNVQV